MIAEAKVFNSHFETNVDFREGDATDLNFPDASFDVVLFSFNPVYAIEFVAKALKAIKSSAYVTSHSHHYGERMIGTTQ